MILLVKEFVVAVCVKASRGVRVDADVHHIRKNRQTVYIAYIDRRRAETQKYRRHIDT